MKKMNRSQSSYRQCKTLVAEEDAEHSKYSKHFPTRNPNTSNSFIENNKENNSLFQSISERNFNIKPRGEVSEFEPGREDVRLLQDKLKRYEEQIKMLYRERESQYHSASNLHSSKPYNSSEQFYQAELEELRSQLQKKEREL